MTISYDQTPRWIQREALKALQANLSFAALLPPVKRVRRRGFRRDVRRGDDVRLADGGSWRVIRRSAWNLWVEPTPTFRIGQTVRVQLPARFEASNG